MKYTKILNNKVLIFIDKTLRRFNYYIELQGVDIEKKEFERMRIKHISQFKCQ